MTKTFAFIFARIGSKGIPLKNLLPLRGIPLFVHSINLAKEIPEISKIFVSTDSKKYADISKNFGANVPFLRSKNSSPAVCLPGLHIELRTKLKNLGPRKKEQM